MRGSARARTSSWPARPVTVSRFAVLDVRPSAAPALDVDIEVEVSSGTYVRALARDLGAALGVGGHLTALRRTRVGRFDSPTRTAGGVAGPGRTGGVPLVPLADAARASVRRARAERGGGHGRRPRPADPVRRCRASRAVAAFAPDGALVAMLDESRDPSQGRTSSSPRRVRRVSPVLRWTDLSQIPGGLRPERGDARQLRRRPPRPPGGARRPSSSRPAPAGPRRGGDVRAAPGRRPAPRARAADHHRPRPPARPAGGDRPGRRAGDGVHPRAGQLDPEQFVRTVFVEALGARVVVVGKDTRFGRRNSGDVGTLRDLGRAARVRGAHPGRPRERRALVLQPASAGSWPPGTSRRRRRSSAARTACPAPSCTATTAVASSATRPPTSARYPPGWSPPTASTPGWLLRPGLSTDDPDRTLPAAVSIGTNPTFDGTQRRVEAYVLDRTDLDLYGETVGARARRAPAPDQRYDSVEALLAPDGPRRRALPQGALLDRPFLTELSEAPERRSAEAPKPEAPEAPEAPGRTGRGSS